MSTVDRSFIGAGSIYLKPADDSAPLLPVGNVSEFKFSVTVQHPPYKSGFF